MKLLSIFFILLLSLSIFGQSSDANGDKYDKWILKIESESINSFLNQVVKHNSIHNIEVELLSKDLDLVKLSTSPISLDALNSFLRSYPILNIYPDYKIEIRGNTPDDESYPTQWSMENISMPDVWELATGGTSFVGDDIVVAVLDIGFDLEHSDLVNNIYRNEFEIPGDNIDNDGNGFVDDYIGLNTQTFNDRHFVDDHGTLVSGIIGAEGNNGIGVAGVNWNIKILPIGGVESVSEIIIGMEYLINMKRLYLESNGTLGANIVVNNLSAGLKRRFPNSAPDWCQLYNTAGELGILSVSAAPNEDFDVDIEGDLPSLCDSEYLITVTNTNRSSNKVRLAGFGAENIDLGAPGEEIFSSDVGSGFDEISGTSASAPHVAGLIGLLHSLDCEKFSELLSQDRAAAAILLKDAILNGVEVNLTLSQTVTSGRLDAFQAVKNITEWCSGNDIDNLDILEIRSSSEEVGLSFSTNVFTNHTVTLSDIQGRQVLVEQFVPDAFDDFSVIIDISNKYISSGIYIVTLANEVSFTSEKIIVVK